MSRSFPALENLVCSSVSSGKAVVFPDAPRSSEYFSNVKYGRQTQVTLRAELGILEVLSSGSMCCIHAGSICQADLPLAG